MEYGDIILVRGKGWLSRLIERVTRSKYSHAAIYVGDGNVTEANGGRVVGYQRLSFYEGQYDVYRVNKPLLNAEETSMRVYLSSKLGCEYDYADIFILLAKNLFRLKLPWHETKRVICSTLVYNAYRYAGIKLCDAENVSPEDLAESPLLYQVTEGGKLIG